MSKLLYIKANPKSDTESRTFQISESFIKEYKAAHPEDEIITLDLYRENISFLTGESLKHIKATAGDANDNPLLKYAKQFKEADKYVFAEPMWNLGIPAILKAYMDYVAVTGITFKYTAEGPVGLCTGKKAINITTRGGEYSEGFAASLENGDRYLRAILGFFDIEVVATIAAQNLDIIGADVNAAVNKAMNEAKAIAKDF